jgi:hypothetical protein
VKNEVVRCIVSEEAATVKITEVEVRMLAVTLPIGLLIFLCCKKLSKEKSLDKPFSMLP